MTILDWIVVVLYLASQVGLGWYLGRKQDDTREYFIGSGRLNPVAVGLSLFATLLSSITYLGIPGEVLGMGPAYLAIYFSYPFIFLVIAFVILPVYMRHRVTSAYELLERRLGLGIRLLGVALFLSLRLIWMALMIYLTSKATAIIVGFGPGAVPWIAAVLTLSTVVYTSAGGMRAVVLTDVMQSLVLYGGTLMVIAVVTWKMGGLGWFPAEWQAGVWDPQPIFSPDPATRLTVAGSMLWVFLWMIATSMGDQVSVQRFMSTQDVRAARRAIATQLIVAFICGTTLGLVGLALLGYFQANPALLPRGGTLKSQADLIFPHFIAHHLPPVVTGCVVSGLLAAAMSSISSGVNSITAVVMTDLLERFGRRPATDVAHVRAARFLALGIGVATLLLSTVMGHVPGNFLAVTNKTSSLLAVPIALLFVFALFVPFANPAGVWLATLASVTAAVLVAFSGLFFGMNPATGLDPVSFQWIAPVALVTGLGVGLPACWLLSRVNRPASAPPSR